MLNQEDFNIKKEAAWAICNLFEGGSEEQIQFVNNQVMAIGSGLKADWRLLRAVFSHWSTFWMSMMAELSNVCSLVSIYNLVLYLILGRAGHYGIEEPRR